MQRLKIDWYSKRYILKSKALPIQQIRIVSNCFLQLNDRERVEVRLLNVDMELTWELGAKVGKMKQYYCRRSDKSQIAFHYTRLQI